MSLIDQTNRRDADDGYQAYYAEKIWRLIPGVYRGEDADNSSGALKDGPLRSFVEVLADAAADQRRSVDRLWADSNIVDCDDWVIPYIAEMLGTRLISEQNIAGRRADVANTIKYRRIAGTVEVLTQLAEDIAGWDAVPSEAFKRLFRQWHSLDCPPKIGKISGTPQHGLARLTRFRVGETVFGAFDDVAHFPDFRRQRGRDGRYNISKVNLHLFRQQAYLYRGVTPFDFGAGRFTLDPSGRDIPLFQPGQPYIDGCKTGEEWQIRREMTCSLFNDARYAISPQVAGASIGASLLALDGLIIRTTATLLDRAERLKGSALTAAEGLALIETALLNDSNRAKLFNDAIAIELSDGVSSYTVAELFGADLDSWDNIDAGTPWVDGLVDPARGRVRTDDDLTSLRFYEGRFAPVGAGSHDRRADLTAESPVALGGITNFEFPTEGNHQINDSQTAVYRFNTGLTLTDNLHVQAANNERPYIRIPAEPSGANPPRFVIDAGANGRNLTLDGLWLGMINGIDAMAQGASRTLCEVVLTGGFNRVCLRNMTLDPGGWQARLPAQPRNAIPTVRLIIAGASDLLEIDRCVLGPIEESLGAHTQCATGTVRISDSIVRGGQTIDGNVMPAFRGRHSTLEVSRSTLYGNVEAARYFIENSIVQGTVSAQDQQGSCIRYSAADEAPTIPLAQPYRCVAGPIASGTFVSRRFGDPGLAQLSELAPESIRRGAENTSEMGVFNRTLDAIKRDDLTYKLSEFTAINTITQLVFES